MINNAVVEKKMLPARRLVSGWLLAIGGVMPRDLLNGGWIDALLVITASDHTEFCQPIQLWTERLERRRQSAPRTLDLFGNRIAGRILRKYSSNSAAEISGFEAGNGQQQVSD